MSKRKSVHLVAGSRGAMGIALVEELLNRGEQVEAIGLNPSPENIKTHLADIYDSKALAQVLTQVDFFYICAGLPYSSNYWLENWPKLIQACITACLETNTVLIFLDNIYMYTPDLPDLFDENTEQDPISIKGKARKIAADLIIDAIKTKGLKSVIARSASFYGPNVINSSLYTSFLDRMLIGKSPQTIFNPTIPITYANVSDNARAMVELALHPETYGQVYHLPVGKPITLNEILAICNRILKTHYKLSVMPKFLFNILSFIVPMFKEIKEVMYQYDKPYNMSYEKFKNTFPNFQPTEYEEGFEKMIESFKRL